MQKQSHGHWKMELQVEQVQQPSLLTIPVPEGRLYPSFTEIILIDNVVTVRDIKI